MTANNPDDVMVYFVYSEKQEKFRSDIEKTMSKKFVPGTVMVRGEKKKFTEMVTDLDSFNQNRIYPDAKVIASGLKSKMKFTKPTSVYKTR